MADKYYEALTYAWV